MAWRHSVISAWKLAIRLTGAFADRFHDVSDFRAAAVQLAAQMKSA
jgi:hypothetical protein